MRKTKKRRSGSGTAGIMIIVLAFLVVMTVQICRIRSKDAEYAAKEKELQQQYEEETERSTEIDDLETYMKSSQYIEDVAKSKLGLMLQSLHLDGSLGTAGVRNGERSQVKSILLAISQELGSSHFLTIIQ